MGIEPSIHIDEAIADRTTETEKRWAAPARPLRTEIRAGQADILGGVLFR